MSFFSPMEKLEIALLCMVVPILAVGVWDLFWLSAGLGESTWMMITPRISPWW